MFAVWLLMSAQAIVDAPGEPQITVTARRFEQTHGVMRKDLLTGRMRCSVTQTSGNPDLDKAVCDIGMNCWRRKPSGMKFAICLLEGRREFLEAYLARQKPPASDR